MKLQMFEKEMDRREFLGHIGAMLLVVFGISGILKALLHNNNSSQSAGYGSSAYGGK